MNRTAVNHLKFVDPVLERLIKKFGHVRLQARRVPPFQSLIHAIAHQQLNGKAANTILNRFQALFGNGQFPAPEQVLKMDVEKIRSAGFSKAKAASVHDVAQKASDGFIPTMAQCGELSDAEIVGRLTEIKGVGRWTADMFLMFNLGRPDVLPVHDFGVRKGFQVAYKRRQLPEPEQLAEFGRKWSPHRSTAALYMYRAADFLKDGEW
ncbi:MAG: DNA-3-methyladenine glycosylase [Verrucomicrobiota bacterium]|jgi:DNA-3-methyladenine glycosylase II